MHSSLTSCLAAAGVSLALAAHGNGPGGWSRVSVKDPGVVAAADFAIAARQADSVKQGDDVKVALVEIMDAAQQVVQGMNYRLTLRVKVGDEIGTAEATVWARVWLEEPERYQLTAWTFVDEKSVVPPSP